MNNSRIPYLKLIPVIIISFIIFKIINRIDLFFFSDIDLISILSPFIWAFAIAYLLNPTIMFLEEHFKLNRLLSISLIYIIVLGLITIIITIISPKIAKSIGQLIKEMPDYFHATEIWLNQKIKNLELFDRYGVTNYLEDYLNNIILQMSSYINSFLSSTVHHIINLTSTFFKIILGLIISIYILKDKEKFIIGIKRSLYAVLDRNRAENIIEFGREFDELFLKYILGKFFDSCIIGVLCYIGLSIIKGPYSLLFSIIVGVTNMIPYFGPFIGMIPAVAITLFYDPIKALWILIFILLLQQFDGLYLGPKILGNSVGLCLFG